MATRARLSVCAALAFLTLFGAANAADRRREVYGFLGWGELMDDEGSLGSGLAWAGAVGYRPFQSVPRLGFELGVDSMHHERVVGGGALSWEGRPVFLSGSAFYEFGEGRTRFYLIGGAGLLNYSGRSRYEACSEPPVQPGGSCTPVIRRLEGSRNDLAINFGAGLKVDLPRGFLVRPELRVLCGGAGFKGGAPVEAPVGVVRFAIGAGYAW